MPPHPLPTLELRYRHQVVTCKGLELGTAHLLESAREELIRQRPRHAGCHCTAAGRSSCTTAGSTVSTRETQVVGCCQQALGSWRLQEGGGSACAWCDNNKGEEVGRGNENGWPLTVVNCGLRMCCEGTVSYTDSMSCVAGKSGSQSGREAISCGSNRIVLDIPYKQPLTIARTTITVMLSADHGRHPPNPYTQA